MAFAARNVRPKVQVAEEIIRSLYGRKEVPLRLSPAFCEGGRLLHADAMGVCNLVSLHYYHGKGYLNEAKNLVNDVHDVLGRERTSLKRRAEGTDPDDAPARLGDASEHNALLGGLRCGKVMGENRPAGDGQVWYSSMLWAWALNRLAVATDDPQYNELAAQLVVISGVKFLQRTLDSQGDGEGDAVAKAPYTLSTRMSIDLSMSLPARPRVTDPLVGALVAGIVLNGLGPRADAKIRSSLQAMERQLANLWKVTSSDTERMAEVSTDAMQLGDLLWVASWTEQSKKWGAELAPLALQMSEGLILGSGERPALESQPLQLRNPVGELWMSAGILNFHQGVVSLRASDSVQSLISHHSMRMNLWGPLGSLYLPPATFGGVFQPHWITSCQNYKYRERNDPGFSKAGEIPNRFGD